MTDTASGVGTAHDAGVVAVDNIPALEAALAEARLRQDAQLVYVHLANAQAKLAKAREHLAAAEAEVARLEAEIAAQQAEA